MQRSRYVTRETHNLYSDNKLSPRELKRENLKLRLLWSIDSLLYSMFLMSHRKSYSRRCKYINGWQFRYREKERRVMPDVCQNYVQQYVIEGRGIRFARFSLIKRHIHISTHIHPRKHTVCVRHVLNETIDYDTQHIWSTIFARIIFGVTSTYKKKRKKRKSRSSDVGARIAEILIVRNLILSCKTFFECRGR